MKKNYFYSLLAALMLFVAMPATAQNFEISDLYGEWKFTADVVYEDESYKSQLPKESDVVISADDTYMAKIVGFAGSQVQQNINAIGAKNGQDMLKINNLNNPQLWGSLYLANADGENPFGIWENGTEVVKTYGPVYYNVYATEGLITIPDFTVVTLPGGYSERNPVVIAKYTNVKMTLVEAEVVEVADISGDYNFKAGTGENHTMPNSVIPTEFAINFTKKSEDNKTYDATVAIEGYNNVVLPATFDGALVKLAYDNTYLDEANGIRFAPMYGAQTSGNIEFKVTEKEGNFTLYSGFAFASDSIGKTKDETADSLIVNGKYHQWYTAGSLKLPSDAPEFDWAGEFTVKTAAPTDVIIADDGASGINWPAEFKMTVQYFEAIDAYYITELFGFDLYSVNNGGIPLNITQDGAEIVLNAGFYGVAFIKNNGDGTFLALTNQSGVNTVPIKLTLNEDGSVSMQPCFIKTYDFSSKSFTTEVVFYQNLTAEKFVEEPEAFDWAGTYVLNAGEVEANDGNTYPSSFEATVVYNEAADKYFVTNFMGNDIVGLNYGGLALTIAEDGNSATVATGYVQTVEPGVTYLKLRDMNASANPVALTLNEDGTVSMANFAVVVGGYSSDDGNKTVAYYQNVVLTKLNLLDAPEVRYPVAEEGKDINRIDYVALGFKEAVAVGSYEGVAIKKDGVAVADVVNVSSNEGKSVVYLSFSANIEEPGTYTLELPEGMFTSEDGSKQFRGATYTFEVVMPKPECYINPYPGSEVDRIEKIMISFKYVSDVTLDSSKAVQLAFGTTGYTGTAAIEEDKDGDKNIVISFDQKFEEEGEYKVMIPAGLFTMKALDGTEEQNTLAELTYTVVAPADITPLEVVSVEPAVATVGQIDEIKVVFNQNVYFGKENWSSYTVFLTNEATGAKIPMWLKDSYDANGNLVIPANTLVFTPYSEMDENGLPKNVDWYGFPTDVYSITEAGTYTFNLADVTVRYGRDEESEWHGFGSCEGTYSWIVDPALSSIDGVDAEEENAEIYDLTGRRVEKITNAGIYIVNGKKVLVK